VKAQGAARPRRIGCHWSSSITCRSRKAFAAVKAAPDLSSRRAAQKKWLAVILTGHANAEESVLYPALALANEKATQHGLQRTGRGQMQMAALETLNPMSPGYLDKLEHVRGAVAHHMYEEEGTWFLELKNKTPPADVAKG